METSNRIVIPVVESSQVGEARRRAARIAQSLGFDETAVGKISIVASELATNLVKHTERGGDIVVQVNDDGLEIMSLNKSPGVSVFHDWLDDGYTTSETLGTGLGAVRRLSNSFDLYSEKQTGTAVLARLDLLGKDQVVQRLFDIGAISLPKQGEHVCGDGLCVVQKQSNCVVMVVDGLGHGIEAAEASKEAIRIFREIAWDSPHQILDRIHRGLKGTRGAAVSIARIEQDLQRLTFCGMGNVVAVIEGDEERRHLVPDNGTAGYEARKIRTVTGEWSNTSTLVMHSDGISSSWNLRSYIGLKKHRAPVIAGVIYRDYSRSRDDSTVLVVKNTPGA